jgi:hypothetical protein
MFEERQRESRIHIFRMLYYIELDSFEFIEIELEILFNSKFNPLFEHLPFV